MASGPTPQFDVVSIHPAPAEETSHGLGFRPDTFWVKATPLSELICNATSICASERIRDLPYWASTNKYDIEAKITEDLAHPLDELTWRQKQRRILEVLTAYFGLKYHLETADFPALALTVDKRGVKNLLPHVPADSQQPDNACLVTKASIGFRQVDGCTMTDLARILSPINGYTVVDRTGLSDRYKLELHWDEAPNPSAPSEWPSIYEALPKQLGLKLESLKAPLPVVVIDHINPPQPN